MTHFLRPTLPLFLVALTAACTGDTTGGMTLNVRLGPDTANAATCSQFDVQEIRATLGDSEYEASGACGDDLVFSDVPAGRWDLAVEAIDSQGFTVLDNGADDERIEILAGSVIDHQSQLTATPAQVMVRWSVNLGGFQAQCSDPMVETDRFRVEAWDDIGGRLAEHTFNCDDPADAEEGASYRVVPDPDRAIKGNLLSEVSVTVLRADGTELAPIPRFMLDTPPGAGRKLFLTVSCDDNSCQSTGDAPFDTP